MEPEGDVNSKAHNSLSGADHGLVDPHIERWAFCGLSIGVRYLHLLRKKTTTDRRDH